MFARIRGVKLRVLQDTPEDLTRASLVEFVNMATFVFMGCSSVIACKFLEAPLLPTVPLAFGLSIAVLAWSTAQISGAHINPAVTFCLLILRKVSPIRAALYWTAQFAGSLLGALLVWAATSALKDDPLNEGAYPPFLLAATTLSKGVNEWNGFVLEIMGTFLLCKVVVQTAIDTRSPAQPSQPPFAIGLAVAISHMVLVPFTGCSINPARTFGPAMVSLAADPANEEDLMTSWWIYWAGPLAGAALAAGVTAILHKGPVDRTPPPPEKDSAIPEIVKDSSAPAPVQRAATTRSSQVAGSGGETSALNDSAAVFTRTATEEV
mmetsp:Transcript_9556/g.18585  ORF Transcript_9556/g.18585 Transcript_9556/m.18585 type:complete len:322 (-) Transcript_9556:715-1680(-)